MPVTDAQANLIHEAVQGFDWRDLLNDFAAVVAEATDRLREAGLLVDIEPWEIGAVSAISVLGPDGRGAPQGSLRDMFLDVVNRHPPAPEQEFPSISELAIAFGCGAFRQGAGDGKGWDCVWANAISALADKMKHPVEKVNRWLDMILGFKNAELNVGDLESRAYAIQLAMWLIHPLSPLLVTPDDPLQVQCTPDGVEITQRGFDEPRSVRPGANRVFSFDRDVDLLLADAEVVRLETDGPLRVAAGDGETRLWIMRDGHLKEIARLNDGEEASVPNPAGISIWECGCGHRDCPSEHRLYSWDPTKLSLWSFLASAVKGPLPDPEGKSYFQGMLASLYAQDAGISDGIRIRLERVECKKCPAPIHSDDEPSLYEGDSCPKCGSDFDPRRTLAQAVEKLILVGMNPDPYVLEPRARCTVKECQNLFIPDSESLRRCVSRTCGKRFLTSKGEQTLFKMRKAVGFYQQIRAVVWLRNRTWDHGDGNRQKLEQGGVKLTNAPPLHVKCAACGEPIGAVSLCPLCRTPGREDGCLSQRPIFVWVRKGPGQPLAGAVVMSPPDGDRPGDGGEIVVIDPQAPGEFYKTIDQHLSQAAEGEQT